MNLRLLLIALLLAIVLVLLIAILVGFGRAHELSACPQLLLEVA